MDSTDGSLEKSWFRQHRTTILMLIVLLAMAAFFRVWFNYDPALNNGNERFAGNDDYYHLRSIRHVDSEGEHLARDPLLNYPVGNINPRPPVFNWHLAIAANVMEMGGMSSPDATAYALEWGSAFWGILTVIPVWLIGRTLYSNRAGLWAGFLVAASPAHIQRSGFGLGDHDAFVIFFFTLGVYFLIRALQLTRDDTRVATWTRVSSIARGFGTYADVHREGLAYAFLAGACWTTIALSWEGFPYVTAVFSIYYGFQLLANHLRRRDSTGDVLVMLIIMTLVTFVPLPYYWSQGHISSTVTANMYVFAGLVAASAFLVPTRDLPSIVVLPSLAGLGVVSWAVLRFVFPDIGQQIFSANGYFLQSKVYSTIAEAQRTDLGFFVFSIGFMTFFLALVGFVYAVLRFSKTRDRDQLFLVAWGLISIYMAFAATRFVFNAAPVFCVMAGWMVAKVLRWMNWRERMRDFRSFRQESLGKALKSTMGGRQIAGGLFLGVTLILPSVWFSFDAGLPAEAQDDFSAIRDQIGAFGQSFLSSDWTDTYEWLSTRDATDAQGNPIDCKDRPAHMAWWDYGFWEVALGCHPTVADNFQNGVDIAGKFLSATSEREAVSWMTVRLLEGDWRNNGGAYTPGVQAALAQTNASLPGAMPAAAGSPHYDAMRVAIENATTDLEGSVALYQRVASATNTYIGYFLADARMLPFDTYNPNNPNTWYQIEGSSILYAPIYLANRNPDDYFQTVYLARNQEYKVESYRYEDGISRQIAPPVIKGPDNKIYFVGQNTIVRSLDGERIDYTDNQGQGAQLTRARLDFKPAFYQSMFYRGYVGGDGTKPGGDYDAEFNCQLPSAGKDLVHFRVVKGGATAWPNATAEESLQYCEFLLRGGKSLPWRGDIESIRLLQFYWGAELNGRLTAGGQPLAGASVEAYDDYGIRHHTTTTDADGNYKVLLPFGTLNDTSNQLNPVKVRFLRGGSEIATQPFQVSEAQALRRATFDVRGDVDVQLGSVEIQAFVDRNRNATFEPALDTVAANTELRVEGKNVTTNATGHAVVDGIVPGAASVTGTLAGYTLPPSTVAVPSGGRGTGSVGFRVDQGTVNGTIRLDNGTAVSALRVTATALNASAEFTADGSSQNSDANGTYSVTLYPGTPAPNGTFDGHYRFTVNQTRQEEADTVTYFGEVDVNLKVGQATPIVDIRVTRSIATT